jgi:hypothetical protein
MAEKLPKIDIDEFERLWLEEVYAVLVNNYKRASRREIWSKLYGKIPKNFSPTSINNLLINSNGEDISLLGIVALERNYEIIQKGTKIINTIKEFLISNPQTSEVAIKDISLKCNLPEDEAGMILYLSNMYGSFYYSASLKLDTIIVTSFNIGKTDECYTQYLYFESLEAVILGYYKVHQSTNAKHKLIEDKIQVETNQSMKIEPIFKSKVTNVNTGLCFILMPFTEPWSDRVYKRLIKQNIEDLGLQCLRADNLNGSIIIEDIWTSINQAAIIISDVTNKNPNVMYEMGIVHTLGKPSILLTQDIANTPFDFRHLRHNVYQDNIEGFEIFGDKLKKIIKEMYALHYPDIKF